MYCKTSLVFVLPPLPPTEGLLFPQNRQKKSDVQANISFKMPNFQIFVQTRHISDVQLLKRSGILEGGRRKGYYTVIIGGCNLVNYPQMSMLMLVLWSCSSDRHERKKKCQKMGKEAWWDVPCGFADLTPLAVFRNDFSSASWYCKQVQIRGSIQHSSLKELILPWPRLPAVTFPVNLPVYWFEDWF